MQVLRAHAEKTGQVLRAIAIRLCHSHACLLALPPCPLTSSIPPCLCPENLVASSCPHSLCFAGQRHDRSLRADQRYDRTCSVAEWRSIHCQRCRPPLLKCTDQPTFNAHLGGDQPLHAAGRVCVCVCVCVKEIERASAKRI